MPRNVEWPPVVFENQSKEPNKPTVTAPDGYFTLSIENLGLPSGYSAPTRIKSTDTNTNIQVPFTGVYELPVYREDSFKIRYYIDFPAKISTQAGEYFPNGNIPVIIPNIGELQKVVVDWRKNAPPVSIVAVDLPKPVLLTPPNNFTLSSTPTRPAPLPLIPTLYELTASADPSNTKRAESVDEMFSIISESSSRKYIYEVGINELRSPFRYKIRNNSMSNSIKITFTEIPKFVTFDSDITLTPLEEKNLSAVFKQSDADEKSIQVEKTFIENLTWKVEPLDVVGPVWVRTNLSTLVF